MHNLIKIDEISKKYNSTLLYNESMSLHTSFKIGGSCFALIKINCVDCLRETFVTCSEKGIPFYILGKGSNVLVPDEGLNGLVILLSDSFSKINIEKNIIRCEAGASLNNVCRVARDNSLTGLEFAYGIPGTIGGAIYMNAGAFGGQMEDVVISCSYLDSDGVVNEIGREELNFSYRRSFFTGTKKIILSASLELKQGNIPEIDEKMNELIKKRREKQPLEYPSAGSTFKRPNGDYASRLIESCGLKGVSYGAAEVSTKHSGFIVNKGGATFTDVMEVINVVKQSVKEQTGVSLELEIEILK